MPLRRVFMKMRGDRTITGTLHVSSAEREVCYGNECQS